MDMQFIEEGKHLLDILNKTKPYDEIKDVTEFENARVPLQQYIKTVNLNGNDILHPSIFVSYIPLLFSIYPVVLKIYGENYVSGFFKNIVFKEISENDLRNKNEYIEKYRILLNDVSQLLRRYKKDFYNDDIKRVINIVNSVSIGFDDVIDIYS